MSDTPQLLLQHHLKKLRLPTFNSEHASWPGSAPPRARTMSSICCGFASWN